MDMLHGGGAASALRRSVDSFRVQFAEVPAMAFSFKKSAELFPAAIRKKKRAGFAYRRFDTAADAVRFAIEELPADSLNGAYLQVDEARFDQNGIRTLYESQDFPLPRRTPTPAPETASQDAA